MTKAVEYTGAMRQGYTPDWAPLLEAIGEDLIGDFMWMYDVRLSDGTLLQAYKHIDTRRYLHLASDGGAFMYEAPNIYRLMPHTDVRRLARVWRESAPPYT